MVSYYLCYSDLMSISGETKGESVGKDEINRMREKINLFHLIIICVKIQNVIFLVHEVFIQPIKS